MAGSIDWLDSLRTEARRRFDAGRDAWRLDAESWKYTRVSEFLPEASALDISNVDIDIADDGDAHDFKQLDAHARQATLETLQSVTHPLADLNLANLEHGLMIHCARGEVKRAHLAIPEGDYVRILVHLEAGSQLDLSEAANTARPQQNIVIQARLGDGAVLTHKRLSGGHGRSWDLIDAEVGRGASYHLSAIMTAPQRERSECRLRLVGEHARATTRHLMIGDGRDRRDLQLGIDHSAPNTGSDHLIKTLAGDHSQLTVRGRMHIASECPGADANLKIESLLLGDSARINAKPELEIYTDDVACAHGTSIAEIDPEQLFYLASRGIGGSLARAVLLKAFASECLSDQASLNEGAIQRIEALAA